jgi:hypothetical protein
LRTGDSGTTIREKCAALNKRGPKTMANATTQIRRTLHALFLALIVGFVAAPTAAAVRAVPPPGTPVYVLRGALGIFSSGMDALADEMNAKGVPAVSGAFENWRDYVAGIVPAYRARPYPVILVGHSWGANTLLLMARELDKRAIPVALLVFYDATASARIPANVQRVINYRSTSAIGGNVQVVGGHGFSGTIDNVTRPDLNHVQIDKAEDLHRFTIDAIRKLLGSP